MNWGALRNEALDWKQGAVGGHWVCFKAGKLYP